MARDLVLIGGGGFAREVFGVIEDQNQTVSPDDRLHVVGVVDDDPGTAGSPLWAARGIGWLGTVEEWLATDSDAVWLVAIGNPAVRANLCTRLAEAGRDAARPVVHPTATVNRTATLGNGTVVCPGAWVGPEVVIGDHVHLNVNSIVGHDAVLGDCVSVNPLVAVCGSVRIGDQVLLGAGATVLEGLSIGAGAKVGAGACVVRDARAGRTVVGVPAVEPGTALSPARAGTSRSAGP